MTRVTRDQLLAWCKQGKALCFAAPWVDQMLGARAVSAIVERKLQGVDHSYIASAQLKYALTTLQRTRPDAVFAIDAAEGVLVAWSTGGLRLRCEPIDENGSFVELRVQAKELHRFKPDGTPHGQVRSRKFNAFDIVTIEEGGDS